MAEYFLGIDTSNYTTSIALTDEKGSIIFDERRLLKVEKGARGLRQSEALFQHIKNLPELFSNAQFDFKKLSAVGVSTTPRREEGSYMPVFLGGMTVSQIIAKTLLVPLFEFSHQEGHIMAGLFSCGGIEDDEFYAIHISGGTTEILSVCKEEERFKTKIVGKTLDISAGQFIDRVGVALGMNFPCGKEMESIAAMSEGAKKLPICVKGTDIHFSGTETKASRMAEKENAATLSYLVFEAVSRSLIDALLNVFSICGRKKVLFVGGVASNSIIKGKIIDAIGKDAYFCEPRYSTDNAVGISLMTRRL